MGGVLSSISTKVNSRISKKGRRSPSSSNSRQEEVGVKGRWRAGNNKLKELGIYLPLYKAAMGGKWNEAVRVIDKDPEALTARITIASETALHVAVGNPRNLHFVENLVRMMSPEELAFMDQNGETALSVAATVGNIEAAKLLVTKNPDLPNIVSKSGFPLHRAAQYGRKDMILYLRQVTREDMDPSPFHGEYGVKLLISTITAELYDIAVELVESYPDMATMELDDVGSPLSALAQKPDAFPSGCNLKLWPHALFFYSFWKHVSKTKSKNKNSIELVKCLCKRITELDDAKAFAMLQEPLHIAAKLGVHEIVDEIVEEFPPAIWSANEDNYNVFQVAVMYRRQTVFNNLVHRMSEYIHLVTRHTDQDMNNILHLAGRLPPSDRLNLVSGVALQMQRELQWFEEVKDIVEPAYKAQKNAEGKTPDIVFSEAHQDLVKEGEKWMKDTANSCTVVATLIATVVFAAAITVPGGNDQNKGTPLFIKRVNERQRAFAVFGVSDAISLFSSVASILMFLSILTARYSETDFLYALPKRLILGFGMLFISITSLMVAFGSALYLVFGENKPHRLFWVGALAFVPVALFVFLQFPLLIEMLLATYGPGIFRKRGSPRHKRYLFLHKFKNNKMIEV